jgi:hypothetical protein
LIERFYRRLGLQRPLQTNWSVPRTADKTAPKEVRAGELLELAHRKSRTFRSARAHPLEGQLDLIQSEAIAIQT